MPIYQIDAPNGKTYRIEGPPGASQDEVIAAILQQNPAAGNPPPETSFLGEAKEFAKGLVPGAVGLVESAAVGASSLLPTDMEKGARESIGSVAGAIKAPFAAAPGYEESVGRKLGEGVGSTAPFLMLGPAGWVGRAGMAGLAVGSGAGTARVRAEQGGATPEEISQATMLGAPVGAMEMFAPVRILARIPGAATAGAVGEVRRLLLAGAEEAAQEAASAFAQNAIAKGLYKPEQELIESVGEDAAYGGAVGAILQGVMDLAIGRRGGGSTLPTGEEPIVKAKREAAEKAAAEAAAKAAKATGQPATVPALPAPATPQGASPTAPTPPTVLPVPPETVRFYHGGNPESVDGPLWFTADERDAKGWASRSPGMGLWYVDVPKGTPGVDWGDAENGVIMPTRQELPPELANQRQAMPIAEPTIRPKAEKKGKKGTETDATGIVNPIVNPEEQATDLNTEPAPAPTEEVPENAAGSDETGGGVSLPVADATTTNDTTPEGTPGVESDGVVPAAEDARRAPVGKGEQYTPVGTTVAELDKEWRALVNAGVRDDRLRIITERIAEVKAAEKSTAEKPALVAPATPESVGTTEAVKPAEPAAPAVEGTPAPTVEEKPAPVEAAAPVAEETPPVLAQEVSLASLRAERNKLLTPSGRVPAPKSKARSKYDELTQKITEMSPEPRRPRIGQPVRQDLAPLEEKRLRIEYNDSLQQLKRIEAANDTLLKVWVDAKRYAEYLDANGIEEGRERAANDLKEAEAAFIAGKEQYKKGRDKSDAAYNKIYDPENIEVEAKLGDAYIKNKKDSAFKAETDRLLNRVPPRTSYPFNLESYEAVVEGVKDEIPHSTPEYQEFMEKYFEPSNKKDGPPAKLRGKYTEADVVAAGKKLLHKMVLLEDTSGAKNPQLAEDIRTGGLEAALQRIVSDNKYTRFPYQRRVAKRLLELGKEYGFPTAILSQTIKDPKGNVREGAAGAYYSDSNIIRLVPKHLNEHVILHEAVHAYTLEMLHTAEGRNSDAYKAVDKLYRYLKYKHPDSLEGAYGMTNLHEFISEVLSNTTLQRKLHAIKFEGETIWDRLVEVFRKLLGLPTPQNKQTLNALFMAAEGSMQMLEPGAKVQAAKNERGAGEGATPKIAEARPPGTPIVEKKEKPRMRDSIHRKLGANAVEGFRAKTMDSYAALAARLNEMYAGNRVSSTGSINPEIEIAAAADSARYAKAAKREGTIIDDTDGMARAGKLTAQRFTNAQGDVELDLIDGEEVSYEKALAELAASNMTQEQLDEMLIGHRDYNIRQLARTSGNTFASHLTDPEIDALENAFQSNTQAQRISQMLDAVRYSLIGRMVSSGRWSEEKAADMMATVGYIPYHRLDELDGEYAKHSTRTGPGLSREWGKYVGSAERATTSPLENFSGLMDWMVKESMLNKARTRALQEMELFQYTKNMTGEEIHSNIRPAIVDTFINGVRTPFYVPDPALLGAFVYPNPNVSGVVEFMQNASRILRAGVTSTPPFVFKQVVDDITRMYAYAGIKNNMKAFGRVMVNFPRFWFDEIRDHKSPLAKRMEEYGLVGTFDFHATSDIRNIMAEAGLEKKSLGYRMLQIMEAGAKASDLAVRAAIFEQIKEETGSTVEAGNAAREIINFSRRGNAVMMDTLIRTVPFFNAFARGTDKLFMAATGGRGGYGGSTGQARGIFWKRMSMLTAMGTVYALLMSGDDDYNALTDQVRDRGIVVPFSKQFKEETGSVPYIPLPADLALIFKAIPERMVQYIRTHGTPEERTMMDITRELMKQGVNIFSSPNITPQMLRPILENMVNHSFFLDRPLESQMQIANYKPYLRTTTNTSELAKWMAEKGEEISLQSGTDIVNVSPIKIDNFIRGFLGSIGGTFIATTDMMLNPSRTDRPIHQQLIPVLTGGSAFLRDGLSTKHMDELYRMEREVEQVKKSYDKVAKKGAVEGSRFMYDNYDLMSVHSAVTHTMESIRRVNASIRAVDEMTQLSPKERREIINKLRLDANLIASKVPELRRTVHILRESMQ